tara:strand:- start:841 stop:1509 length:669 start_codon:yes stop_codon:yes gene_type:complete
MAQSQRTFPYADLLIVVGRLPFWANLVCALLSWVVLRHYANSPLPLLSGSQSAGILAGPFFRQLAMVVQYVLPLAFVAAALLAVFNCLRLLRHRRAVLTQNPAALLNNMAWPAFFQLLEQAWRRKGYRLLGSSLTATDASCDLLLQHSGERYLAHCQHWRASKLGVTPLRELFDRIVTEGAVGGFVVTCGEFSDEARAFAAERQLELIDGARLQRWLLASQR